MSYMAFQNTCTASTLAKQTTSNKPQYTPSKALKKAFKLLSRFFKPSTTTATPSKSIKVATKEIITAESQAAINLNDHTTQASTPQLDESIITICSTLSVEECENELNELAELAVLAKLNAE